ncbi:MAG: family peptidase [Segetibacter sp.]|nr:family peptidase [Segetibacter sp.]
MIRIWLIVLLFPFSTTAQNKKITLEDVYQLGTFRAENVPGFRSMSDGRFYTETSNNALIKKNFLTGETVDTIARSIDAKDRRGKQLNFTDIEWNDTETKLLIAQERESIYRHSSKAMVYAYDLKTKNAIKIDDEKVLHATYSPDATKVAFVKNNNLYYKDLLTNKTTQVTKDGEWNKIINGNADWVYEEEFSFTKAFQWSPNGTNLAYYKFDESKVPQYSMTLFNGLYPTQYNYKYPKAGEPNSIIEIHTYNLATAKDVKVDIGTEKDIYIPRIKWTTKDNQLAVAWMNRLQNHLKWLIADATTGTTKTLYEEKNKYYVDITDDFSFLKDGNHFITSSEKDGHNHIYLYQIDGKLKAQITSGNYDIDHITGVDEKNKTVYYTAAYYSPLDRQLFAANYSAKKITPTQITQGRGTHRIDMNSDFTYYVDNYSTINQPAVISIFNTRGKLVKTLKDNAALKNKLTQFSIAATEFIRVPNTKGDTLNGWMLKPASFENSKKYPVLFCNYGGPGSQQVADRWGATSMWHQYLAQNGYIIVSIDNTGTGFRGEEFKKKTYLQLGKLEIEDQVDAAKYLGTLPFVDKNRIGHWGWSYGGFMSSLAITKGADVFKAAVAVAPVTNWRFYDNIYTERFMRTPQENPQGYDENSPLNFTDKIKGKYLIIHGTADDNVHFQNSVTMIDKMIQKNIDFESAYYPNKNHSISGGNTTFHIYRKMTDFILKNL